MSNSLRDLEKEGKKEFMKQLNFNDAGEINVDCEEKFVRRKLY